MLGCEASATKSVIQTYSKHIHETSVNEDRNKTVSKTTCAVLQLQLVGDYQPAYNAELWEPSGLALDKDQKSLGAWLIKLQKDNMELV